MVSAIDRIGCFINICFSCIVLKICLQPVREGRIQAAPGAACGEPSPGGARRRNRQIFAPLFIAIGPSGKSAKRGFHPLKFAPVFNVLWLAAQGQSLRGGRCLALAASFETAGKYPRITGFSERHCGPGACDAAQAKAGCPPLRYGLGAIFFIPGCLITAKPERTIKPALKT